MNKDDSPPPPRRPRRRPPYALLPFLMLLSAAVVWGMGGCGPTPAFLSSPMSVGQAMTERTAAIRIALDAFKEGRGSDGQGTLRRIAQASGDTGQAYAAIADDVTQNGHSAEAAQFLKDAARDPERAKDPLLWSALANAYRSARNADQAGAAEAEAVRRADAILSSAGKPAPAQPDELKAAVERFLAASQFYADRRQAAPALKAVREAFRLKGDDPQTLNALGYMLADLGTTPGDIEEALQMTRRAVLLEPDNAAYLDSYGWALFKKDDLPGARRVLREAADGAPDMPEIHYHLGVVYGAMGLNGDAGIELDRALQLRPGYADARHAREMLRSQPPGKGVLEGA